MLPFAFAAALVALSPAPVPNQVSLQALHGAAQATQSSTLAIALDGETVGEWYFDGPKRAINVQSITKAISALALGPLLGRPKLASLDASLAPFFPAWAEDGRRAITLRHLLRHTTGLAELPDNGGDSWKLAPDAVALAAQARIAAPAGSAYQYSSKSANLLGEVVQQVSGENLVTWATHTLFAPLGIRQAPWFKDAYDHPQVSGGLALEAPALLAIGQLMLDKGRRGNQQLIAQTWIESLLRPDPNDVGPSRGLYWWTHEPTPAARKSGEAAAFYAHGWMGQWLVVVPERKLVVVRQYDIMRGLSPQQASFPDFARWAARLDIPPKSNNPR
jgi:CubicO group peptidase (beta-lactamase class C family)